MDIRAISAAYHNNSLRAGNPIEASLTKNSNEEKDLEAGASQAALEANQAPQKTNGLATDQTVQPGSAVEAARGAGDESRASSSAASLFEKMFSGSDPSGANQGNEAAQRAAGVPEAVAAINGASAAERQS